ncbi:MAG: cryptochrome/photolyase family protein [Thiobacillus sp.]|nr:cryptochrome/photolyase family protein [Thiobacillus sp.]
MRNLVLVLGDQLNRDASAWDGFDPRQDSAWMAEVADESTHVWSSKPRIALFLAAMRHFAADLRADGVPLVYHPLDAYPDFSAALAATIAKTRPHRLVVTEPGEWRVLQTLAATAAAHGIALDLRADRHFYCSRADFARHAGGRKQLRMEYFYREQRRRFGVLMDGDAPVGGAWNYDAENRSSFGARGPGLLPERARFAPDDTTRAVLDLVNTRFAAHPGALENFDWPVTRAQALTALARFIEERLPCFGAYQDAMWTNQPWLYHAQLSAALNLKLLAPHEVVQAAETAFRTGHVPLAAAEGFIRQILGWREYVRGVYWHFMPGYSGENALDAHAGLPTFYWTGDTDMACLADTLRQTFATGYAHHIQRLMVTGLYALLLGVEPGQIHAWYLAAYVDAVEWVELPNTLGMSQFADGGAMASKPYAATGQYIHRMSNYCKGCRYNPAQKTGDAACPFTTLYWDFLLRNETKLVSNPRMALQMKNLARLDAAERDAIRARSAWLGATRPAASTAACPPSRGSLQ